MGYSDNKLVHLKLRDELTDGFINGVKALCQTFEHCRIVGMESNKSVSIRHRFSQTDATKGEHDCIFTFVIRTTGKEPNTLIDIFLDNVIDASNKKKNMVMPHMAKRQFLLNNKETALCLKKNKPVTEFRYGMISHPMKYRFWSLLNSVISENA